MASPEIHYHNPSLVKRALERIGLREITPADIVPTKELLYLFEEFPDLGGDKDIGWGDSLGACQSYCGAQGWWKTHIDQYGKTS